MTTRTRNSDTEPTWGSVVIPAHNEAGVIRRGLDVLFAGVSAEALDVVVVCNGCTDATAAVARDSGHPVRVIELPQASKAAALRAGDRVARGFPRLYLDADVVLPGESAQRVLAHLRAGALAARPPIRYETGRSSAPVRSYYRARAEIPAVLGSLWGAGVYGLSETARSRFEVFPDLGADDLWLDRLFAPHEIEVIDCPPVIVFVPRTTRDLLWVLRRTYGGKEETRAGASASDRATTVTRSALGDLARLARRGGTATVDAAVYAAFATAGRLALAFAPARGWARDDASRSV